MPGGWQSLPLEIRWMIRDHIRSLMHQWYVSDLPRPQLSLVCREWHGWFLHENFRLLVLDQDRLDDFERLVSNNESRRDYVEHIILRAKLPVYSTPAGRDDEEEDDPVTACATDLDFPRTLQRFMAIVSTWAPFENRRGITLYLEADSPYDGRHCLFTDKNGGRMRTLSDIAPAPIINSLVLRPHSYCQISPSVLDCLVRRGLPNLQSFRHEMCRKLGHKAALRFAVENLALLDALPSTLNSYSLFREPSALLEDSLPQHLPTGPDFGLAAVTLATRLRYFCASYSISAEDFLAGSSVAGLPEYRQLEHLVLTSMYLRGRICCNAPEFVALIVTAGCTAFLSMPKLKSLILWDGNMSEGFLMRFFYTRNRQPAIRWRSTWHAKRHLSPAFAKLRRILGGLSDPHDGEYNLQIVRIRSRAGKDHAQGATRRGRLGQDSTEFPELRKFILHPKSAKLSMFDRIAS